MRGCADVFFLIIILGSTEPRALMDSHLLQLDWGYADSLDQCSVTNTSVNQPVSARGVRWRLGIVATLDVLGRPLIGAVLAGLIYRLSPGKNTTTT
jgi:hypothetical protein